MHIFKKNREKRSVAQIIKDTIVNIIMVAAVGIFILALYTMYQNQDNPNEAFLLGYKPVYVMTGSMEPTLRVNGIVIIKEVSYDDIVADYEVAADGYIETDDHKNDKRPIVMYEIDDKMITHRVVDVSEEGIRTKGDNNNVQDAYYLQPENIRGEVIAVWNWTAKLVEYWKSPQKRARMITIAVALVVFVVCLTIGLKMILKQKNKQEPSADTFDIEPAQDVSSDIPSEITQEGRIETLPPPRHALSKEEAESTLYVLALYEPAENQ